MAKFDPLPSKEVMKKMDYFFIPYNFSFNFSQHMNFNDDNFIQEITKTLEIVNKEPKNDFTAQELERLGRLLTNTDPTDEQTKLSKWNELFKLLFNKNEERTKKFIDLFWRIRGIVPSEELINALRQKRQQEVMSQVKTVTTEES